MLAQVYTRSLVVLLLVQHSFSATLEEWKKRSIYQVLTDRFALPNNDSTMCDTSARKYCGGQWKGITNHLDYIQNMGFDAVWISPVVENVEGETAYGEAYHGYWTQNINNLNAKFGVQDDLNDLSAALHSRGMYLMVDVVVNHLVTVPVNDSRGSQTLDFSTLLPFSSESNYHPRCEIKDYNNQTNVEQCWLGDQKLPLADLNTEDDGVVKTMNQWINNLVKTYNIDGLRIDTAKHVRRDFWPTFVQSAGVFSMGEVLSDSTSYTAEYTEVLDGVLDYPTWFSLTAAFKSPSGNLSALSETVTRAQKQYKNGAFSAGSFLENHDQPRFRSVTQDEVLVMNAMMWPFINDGIPILYYGQEQGFAGASDPTNREALWPTAFDTSKPLVNHVKRMNAARKAAMSANSNFTSVPASFIAQSNTATLVISKPPLVGLLTNVGDSSDKITTWEIPGSSRLFKSGEQVVDVLTCQAFAVDSNGSSSVLVESGMPKLLLPMSVVNSLGDDLCPKVNTKDNAGFTNVRSHWLVFVGMLVVTLIL